MKRKIYFSIKILLNNKLRIIKHDILFFLATNNFQIIRNIYWKIFSRIDFFKKELSNKNDESFLASSEKGVYLISEKGRARKILNAYCFGIAIDEERIYMAISSSRQSKIISKIISKNKIKVDNEVHFIQNCLYHNEKIHQIAVDKKNIYIANSAKNSITLVEKNDKNNILNIFPFKDFTGYPICTDHNHINSVYPLDDGIIFIAHNGGNIGSLIGVIKESNCIIYEFNNRGIHDIVPLEKGILFSDSFGNFDHNKSSKPAGSIFYQGKLIKANVNFLRGIYLGKNNIFLGSSFCAKRDIRFSGKGNLLIADNNFEVKQLLPMPFSQLHDLIGIKGRRSDSPEFKLLNKIDPVIELLDSSLGPRLYSGTYLSQNSRQILKGDFVECNIKDFLP